MTDRPILAQLAFRYAASPLLVIELEFDDDGNSRMGAILDCSETFATLAGQESSYVVGRRLADFVHPDDAPGLGRQLTEFLDPLHRAQVRILHPMWGVVWVALAVAQVPEEDAPSVVVVSLDDITGFRRAQEELARRASHDSLTGLPDRAVLMSHLSRSLAMLDRQSGTVAVMFIDLDGFKDINDSYGHDVGDDLLESVAGRITQAVRRHDVVTRVGGDEFVVVCQALEEENESSHVAQRIREAIEAPFEIAGRRHLASASIGVTQTSDSAADPEGLVRQADLAMYRAKELGRNRVEFFVEALDHRARKRMQVVEHFRDALDSDGIRMELQPIVRLADSSVVGYEALARIHLPDGRVWRSSDFVSYARDSGLVGRLDDLMMDQALAWLASSPSGPWLAVSPSPDRLADDMFTEDLLNRLRTAGIPPWRLIVEIGEQAIMVARGAVLESIDKLRAAGVRVALDDLGSGKTSLSEIREWPVDILKIDSTFVERLGELASDESILKAMISVTSDSGRSVIAKGVETREQAEFLHHYECEMAQGYLFGSPEPVAIGAEPQNV